MQENDVLVKLANQDKSLQATFKNTHKNYKIYEERLFISRWNDSEE